MIGSPRAWRAGDATIPVCKPSRRWWPDLPADAVARIAALVAAAAS